MNEAAAREVVFVRALESADSTRTLWSDDDRTWAGRAAAEVVGAGAPVDVFLARRAALAVERLAVRQASVPRLLRAGRWRPIVGAAVVVAAFALGLLVDRVGVSRHVNILAFPLLGILAWNAAVYVAMLVRGLVALVRASPAEPGPIAQAVARASTHALPVIADTAPMAAVLGAFARDWAHASAALQRARVGAVLHLSACAVALGAVAGLYVRGLVLEYRAGWESTFLDADAVHRLLALVLGPAAALTGIPVADAAHLESIRFGAGGQGENAAHWIHLYAVTVAAAVLVPRGLLALGAWARARRWRRRFPLPLDAPYFQRLARQVSSEAARVRVVPYGYQPSPQQTLALQSILARTFGAGTDLTITPVVAWGGEDELPDSLLPSVRPALVAALFNLASTPEPENHGAFLAALRRGAGEAAPCVALVDESGFRQRFGAEAARLDERRTAWRGVAAAQGVEVLFVDLAAPDLAAADAELNAVLDRVPVAAR